MELYEMRKLKSESAYPAGYNTSLKTQFCAYKKDPIRFYTSKTDRILFIY